MANKRRVSHGNTPELLCALVFACGVLAAAERRQQVRATALRYLERLETGNQLARLAALDTDGAVSERQCVPIDANRHVRLLPHQLAGVLLAPPLDGVDACGRLLLPQLQDPLQGWAILGVKQIVLYENRPQCVCGRRRRRHRQVQALHLLRSA